MKRNWKSIISFMLALFVGATSFADGTDLQSKFNGPETWSNFDSFMHEADKQDQEIGWSYLASGVLVMVGGTLGSQYASDDATKIVYGIAATLGVGASAYGLERLYNGNNFTAFYDSVKDVNLTEEQRNQLVAHFIEQEKQRDIRRKRIGLITNLVMGGLNLYSAAQEPDKNTKTLFYALAGINLGLSISYAF